MSVPNLFHVVAKVYHDGHFNLATKQGCGEFTEACAAALHAVDAEFGGLRKVPPQNHWTDPQGNAHAVDAVLHKATGFAIDLIENSEASNAKPGWGVKTDLVYPPEKWYAPTDTAQPTPGPSPSPAPEPGPTDHAPPFSYDDLIKGPEAYVHQIGRALTEHRGGYSDSDIAHFLWGMFVERRTLEAILKEIRG